MRMRKFSKIVALFVIAATLVFTLSPAAAAFMNKAGSITLTVKDPETQAPLQGESFRIYFFAKAYESGNTVKYELIKPYDECRVEMNNLQDAYLPVHLAYFAASNNLEYTEKSTDENGVVSFESLIPGLYLVVPSQSNGSDHLSSPFIVSVPEYDSEKKDWNFNIIATPKVDGDINGDDSGKKYITVQKKWETDSSLPASITVVLLRDFQEFEKIELNAENNWYHRWDDLSKDHVWSVVEVQVPDGYTVHYETSSNTVTIINKQDKEEEPGNPDEPPTNPSEPDDDDDLADTGQLNWPIPVFAIAGLLLFSIGWAMLNFGKKESD